MNRQYPTLLPNSGIVRGTENLVQRPESSSNSTARTSEPPCVSMRTSLKPNSPHAYAWRLGTVMPEDTSTSRQESWQPHPARDRRLQLHECPFFRRFASRQHNLIHAIY